MKISALICVDQDVEYLPLVIEQLEDIVDEIVIVDGPYRWIGEFYGDLPLDFNARVPSVQYLGEPLLNHRKVKYTHQIWANEQQKRAFGYNECSAEIVLVVDSDEIFEFDREAIEVFEHSDDAIGIFSLYSLARTFARAEYTPDYLTDVLADPNRPHQCYRLFKKKSISADQHLPYLQVLNLPSGQPLPLTENHPVHANLLGTIFHLSLMRTGESNLSKYRFYLTAHRILYAQSDPILTLGKWENYHEMLKDISIDDYTSLLLRSQSDSIRCPDTRLITPFTLLPEKFCDRLRHADDAQREFGINFTSPLIALPDSRIYIYLPHSCDSGASFQIEFAGLGTLTAYDYNIHYFKDNRGLYRKLKTYWTTDNAAVFEVPHLNGEERNSIFERLVVLVSTPRPSERFGRITRISPA